MKVQQGRPRLHVGTRRSACTPAGIPVGASSRCSRTPGGDRADDPRASAGGRRSRVVRPGAAVADAGGGRLIRVGRLLLLLIMIVLLQTAVLPYLRIFGVVPDLGLVATVAIAYREGPELGAIFGFAAGPGHGPVPPDPARADRPRVRPDRVLHRHPAGRAAAQRLVGHPAAGGHRRDSSAACSSSGSGPWSARSSCGRFGPCGWCSCPASYDAIIAPIVFPIAGFAARGPGPRTGSEMSRPGW